MVGVPGKYKGCETCRRRRVKCDNTKPLCRKCLDNGRDCEGYNRERVFITSGVEQGGRCSSHPRRQAGGSSGSEKSGSRSPEKPQQARLALEQPPGSSARDGAVALSSKGTQHAPQVVAFHADVRRMARVDAGGGRFTVEGAAYSMPDFRVPFGEELDVEGQCLVHVSGKTGGTDICAFVYQHSSASLPSGSTLPWASQTGSISAIRSQGPQAFQTFPAHHFFARIYRPHAIGQALLSRCGTFLETRDWTTTPWTNHPKTAFDNLLDTISRIPAVLSRADALLSSPLPQNGLQDLLDTAYHIEGRLGIWYKNLMPDHWPDGRDAASHIPFGGALTFHDGESALVCVYYWTALLLLYPSVLALRRAALPPSYGYQADDARYTQGRQLAGWICQSLDFAATASQQPDLLAVPLAAAEGFYGGIEGSGYGALELVWCDGFRNKLALRGESLAGLLQGRKWTELGRF